MVPFLTKPLFLYSAGHLLLDADGIRHLGVNNGAPTFLFRLFRRHYLAKEANHVVVHLCHGLV